MFRFAAVGVGGAAIKNDRKFLGFAPREQGARGRGAKIIRQNPTDFARNTFELRLAEARGFEPLKPVRAYPLTKRTH